MFSELVKRNSRRSRRENGLFFTSLLIAIIAFYIILSLSHQDVMVFLQRMESDAVNRLLTLVPVLYGLTLFILFFLVYYANRFQLARRRHEFGVYLMLGMQRRKLFGMLLAEDLRSSLIALAIGRGADLGGHQPRHGAARRARHRGASLRAVPVRHRLDGRGLSCDQAAGLAHPQREDRA